MLIASWNVNGIRAVERKGELQNFLEVHDPDVVFFQETKAKPEQLAAIVDKYDHYQQFYHAAEKPGYSGTAAWIKTGGYQVDFFTGMPDRNDTEGRISRLSLPEKNLELLGVYFPNGGKSRAAWEDKLVFYEQFLAQVNQLRFEGKQVIWCGDVNCAHNEIDLARPESNRKSIGFLPEERSWISKCIEHGWSDIWRARFPEEVVYSWWHVISRARERNVGWRIDYFFCDEALMTHIKHIEYLSNQMGSDHCPVIIEM